jgi:hypothetical protein
MATERWRPGGARVGVARAGEASGGDARAVLGLGRRVEATTAGGGTREALARR